MAVIESLNLLTQISLLLLIGMGGTALARKLKISNILILLLFGLVIGKTTSFFNFEPVFLIALAVLTLAIVVFEGTSVLSYRQVDQYSVPVLKLTMLFVLFSVVIVGLASYFLFFSAFEGGLILAIILAVALAGTDPSSVMVILQNSTGSLIRILTLESVVNTPIIVLIPFILLDALTATFSSAQLLAILLQIVVGVGMGVIIGLVLFKALRHFYSIDISPIAVIAGALLSYIGAENMGGSGVLAVATMGLLFGNFTIKNKEVLRDFSFVISTILELLIFLLIGIMIGGQLQFDWVFLLQGLVIFIMMFLARLGATYVVFKDQFSRKELLFCAVTMPKGVAVAVLIFSFAVINQIPEVMLSTLFIVSIYSILAATIAGWWWTSGPQKKKEAHSGKNTA